MKNNGSTTVAGDNIMRTCLFLRYHVCITTMIMEVATVQSSFSFTQHARPAYDRSQPICTISNDNLLVPHNTEKNACE